MNADYRRSEKENYIEFAFIRVYLRLIFSSVSSVVNLVNLLK